MRTLTSIGLFLALIWATISVVSCTKVPVTPAPAAPPPVVEIPAQKIVSDWPSKEWDTIAARALDVHGKALLDAKPLDAAKYCQGFSKLDWNGRRAFYVMLLSAMARYESSFKPETTYKEAFKDRKGNFIISAGLLQLSVESGNAYGCGLKETKDLFSVETNLACGVRILNKWVSADKYIGSTVNEKHLGGARYWAVFRPHSKVELIRAKTRALEICR